MTSEQDSERIFAPNERKKIEFFLYWYEEYALIPALDQTEQIIHS